MAKLFDIPFAQSGDVMTIPSATQPDGSVSWTQGFPIKYSTAVGDGGLKVPRDAHNELFYQITLALQYLQFYSTPEFYTSIQLDDGYMAGVRVRYSDDRIYKSLIDDNDVLPGSDATKWQLDDVPFVARSGDTMTGNLAISKSNPIITLTDTVSSSNFLINYANTGHITLNNQKNTGNMILATNNGSGAVLNLYYTGDSAFTGALGIGGSAGANIMLDVQSTTKAVRFVPMTTTQKNAISSPQDGFLVYDTTLHQYESYNTATGSWGAVGSQLAPNLQNLNVNWASNTTLTVTADVATLYNASNQSYVARSVSATINCATNGANGLDTGSLGANTWYYVYIIYNPATNTKAALASASSSSPTLPSGYTYYTKAISAFRTSSGATIIGFKQVGADYQYVVGSNLSAPRVMATGSAGNISTPTWVAVAVGNFVPTAIASSLLGYLTQGTDQAIVAPNNSYAGKGSLTAGPPVTDTGDNASQQFTFLLESTNIYWASQTNNVIMCMGFTVNL